MKYKIYFYSIGIAIKYVTSWKNNNKGPWKKNELILKRIN